MVITTKGSSPFSDILEINTDALEVTQLEVLKASLGIDQIIQMIDNQGANLTAQINTLETNDRSHATNINNLQVAHGSRLLDLETRGSGSVWFDAVRETIFEASGNYKTITYENVRQSTNYQAMDKDTGVFTAPLAGTYQFFIQAEKYDNVLGAVKIVVDGTTVSYIVDVDKSNEATITGTAIIDMQPGQKAWAETYRKLYSYSDDPAIHFTGVLITPK
jgi:hypothetical protein